MAENEKVPENAKRDSLGEPLGTGDEHGNRTYVIEGEGYGLSDQTSGGYRESDDHVPDPTALTGTLETSGTGGGAHERLTGTTQVFGNAEDTLLRVQALIDARTAALQEEVRGMLIQQQETVLPQQTTEEHGLPAHDGPVVAAEDPSGVAQPAERSTDVAEEDGPQDATEGYVAEVQEHFKSVLKGVTPSTPKEEEPKAAPAAKKTAAATRRNTKK